MAPRLPWPALLVLSGAAFATVTTELLPASLLPEIGADLGVRAGAAGLLVAVWAVTVAVASLPLTRLTAGVRRATLLPSTLLVFAVATGATALAPSYPWVLAGRVAAAAAHGLFWSVVVATAATLAPPALVGRAVAVVLAGPAVAGVVGIPLAAVVGDAVGWRVAFGVLAALLAVAAPTMRALALPDPPPSPATGRVPGTTGAVVRIAVAGGLMLTGHFMLYTYVAPLLSELGGYDAAARSLLLLAFGIAGVVGIVLSGPLTDRFPRHALLGVGIALAVAATVLRAVAAGPVVTVAAFVLWGLLIGLLPPAFQTMLLRAAPPGREAVAGAVGVGVLNLGIAVGAAVGGVVADRGGVAALPTVAAVTVAVATVVLAGAARRRTLRAGRTAPPGPGAAAAATRRTPSDHAG